MNEKERYAKERAQAAVKKVCLEIRRRGIELPPNGVFQRLSIHDNELMVLFEFVGRLLPGGITELWDAVRVRAEQELDKAAERSIQVASEIPPELKQ